MTPRERRAAIERAARAAGAGAVAVTPAGPDVRAAARMRAAFARGDFATWGYDDAYAERAAAPAALLADAKSVVCIAVPYATPAPDGRGPLTGRVSNYAWAADYHVRMRELLGTVAAAIDGLAGGPSTRIVCDTAPLAERAFAERSGLGWVGKHTNLIAPGLGSFVFLGEIVTTLEVAADAPLRKSCGGCRRCVDVCPTGALRGDYTIDATRCISDLTQRTDGIPRELRPLVGEWIWGCDLCQDVCPPTRRARATPAPAFAAPAASAAFPPLLQLLTLRSAEFKRRFARSAMGWRGAAVLRRNAAVALGNAGDRAAVPSLVRALAADPHPMVRGHVAWALGRIGAPAGFAALERASQVENNLQVREEIRAALAERETFATRAAL